MSVFTIRLPSVLAQQLERLAKNTGRTKAFYVTKALEERLEVFQQIYQPLVPTLQRDVAKIKKAIVEIQRLRFKKPEGMTLKEMIEEGRS